MLKMVIEVYRKPGMSLEEFEDYWLNKHGPLVRKHGPAMGMKRYVQSHNVPSEAIAEFRRARGWAEPCEALAEVWWESEEAMLAAMSSPEGQEASKILAEDEVNFCDMTRLTAFLAKEHEIYNHL
jgi:uncharacterized protein (TIGR02118 family)